MQTDKHSTFVAYSALALALISIVVSGIALLTRSPAPADPDKAANDVYQRILMELRDETRQFRAVRGEITLSVDSVASRGDGFAKLKTHPMLAERKLSIYACNVPQRELLRWLNSIPADSLGATAGARGPAGKDELPWEEDIRRKLREPVSFDFIDTPLKDVARFLNGLMDVPVVADARTVEQAAPRLEVTFKVKDVPLDETLKGICRSVGLDYSIGCGAIVIAAPESIPDFEPVSRTYDLHDILFRPRGFPGLVFRAHGMRPTLPDDLQETIDRQLRALRSFRVWSWRDPKTGRRRPRQWELDDLQPATGGALIKDGWLTFRAHQDAHRQVVEALNRFGPFADMQLFCEKANRPVWLKLKQAALADVIGFLSEVTDLKIMADANIERRVEMTKVDLVLENVKAWQALLQCCRKAGLACRVEADLTVHVFDPGLRRSEANRLR